VPVPVPVHHRSREGERERGPVLRLKRTKGLGRGLAELAEVVPVRLRLHPMVLALPAS